MFLTLPAYRKALFASLIALVLISIAPSLLAARPTSPIPRLRLAQNAAAAALISHNWSGYVATNGTFTSVTGTWNVPQVSGSGHSAADATWVGIGGLNRDDLIQGGTQDIVSHGQITTLAFIELLPDAGQSIPISINRGDSVTVSLTEYASNQWHFNFRDNTNGQVYATTVAYPSSRSSAEWIEEAPSSDNKILNLANFSSVQFNQGLTTEGGHQVTIAQSNAQSIVLVNKKNRTLATPSSLYSDGASFAVTRK